jgi:stage II sporulation protein D
VVGEAGCALMRLMPSGAVLLTAIAAVLNAQSEMTVRLYAVHPPEEARVNGERLAASPAFRGRNVPAGSTVEVTGAPRLHLNYPLAIGASEGRLTFTVKMPLEDYVAAALTGESGGVKPEEALKAMAIATRTYAVKNRGRHRDEAYDFCDTTHCQDLRLAVENPRMARAAAATEGEMSWYRGSLASTFYHRDCGGHLETAREVWPGEQAPYLQGREDPYCLQRGRYSWQSSIPMADLERALGLRIAGPVEVLDRSLSGRVRKLRVGSTAVDAGRFELAVWRNLGWNKMRSRWFTVVDRGDSVVLEGYGAGHGVGLCHMGAIRRGEAGQSHREILEFYFPGTVTGVNAQGFRWQRFGGERVTVEALDEAAGREAAALADRLLIDVERRLRLRYEGRPVVRLFATVDDFRNATGEPGWVAASTRGHIVRLQPTGLLRSRGVLEPVLRHELFHVVIEAHAHPLLPEWFREGLVLHLSGDAARTAAANSAEAAARRQYQQYRARVSKLAAEHGEARMIEWLRGGLPAGVAR